MDKGDIVYIQGSYKGVVVKDVGSSVRVKPLEGVATHCKGNIFTYGRDLLKKRKEVTRVIRDN